MGIYTNGPSGYGYTTSSHYTEVEPYHGTHFNYHELGIIAATESAANHNAFMKAIALSELASVEQYGTEQVFYEAVNIKGIFEKIKAFFKKIIEKIHKIFHTFVARMGAWFGNAKDFAKKYEKEIIKNWGLIKNDWEFKGYVFTSLETSKITNISDNVRNKFKGNDGLIDLLGKGDLEGALRKMSGAAPESDKWEDADQTALDNESKKSDADQDKDLIDSLKKKKAKYDETRLHSENKEVKDLREHMDEFKDHIRQATITAIKGGTIQSMLIAEFDIKARNGLDSKEYTEELEKVFRDDKDSKEDIEKNKILGGAYGGSISGLLNYLKEYDKIKDSLDKVEKAFVKSVDELIHKMDQAENKLIKDNKDSADKSYEGVVQTSSLFQSVWGAIKEIQLQAFSANLQATKDCCAQAKEICVKVVGLNKEMTEESYDYSRSYGNNGFSGSFMESVKLV